MNQHTEDIIGITVKPNIRMLPLIQKITQEIVEQVGLAKDRIPTTALAMEEVFGYCVKMLRTEKKPSGVTITYRQERTALHIIIEHQGPQGILERYFRPGREESFKLTTFDAVGLKIARDVVDDLRYVRDYDGTNRFTVTINLPPEFASQ